MCNLVSAKSVKGKELVFVPIEQQLSTLRRWLTALTVITIALAITVFVLASTRFEHIRAYRIEVAPPNKPALIVLISRSDAIARGYSPCEVCRP